jgi:serine/threonine protein phosphatase PrpC
MPRKGFGRASPASKAEPRLRARADATSAWWRAEGGANSWCVLRAASAVGVRHRLDGSDSDDFYSWAYRNDRMAVAVADGLGSVPESSGAARRACTAAAVEALEEASPLAGIEAGNEAATGGGATTLVVAVLEAGALLEAGARCCLARVGDSTAFLVGSEGSWTELFEAPDPDRADRSTAALPDHAPPVDSCEVHLDPGDVLVVATDGLADPWRDGPTTVGPAMTAGVLGRPGPLELAKLVDFSRRGCHDDRTAVCVWLAPLPGVGEGVHPGSGERLHLDDVAAGGDEAGDEDREGGEEAPAHPRADQEDKA